jgi:hypothetical protein
LRLKNVVRPSISNTMSPNERPDLQDQMMYEACCWLEVREQGLELMHYVDESDEPKSYGFFDSVEEAWDEVFYEPGSVRYKYRTTATHG